MHSYATDAADRTNAPIIIGFLSVFAALGLSEIVDHCGWKIAWWVDAPSVLGFYGIFHQVYNRWLWKTSVFGFSLSQIPNIGGTWVGYIESEHPTQPTVAVVHIRQYWSRILIRLQTSTSRSVTTMAALNSDEQAESGLKYEYVNEPNPSATATMVPHRGTAVLRMGDSSARKLVGEYYTGRGRKNIGTLEFRFVSTELLPFEQAIQTKPSA